MKPSASIPPILYPIKQNNMAFVHDIQYTYKSA